MWFEPGWNIFLGCGDWGKMTKKKLLKFKNQTVFQNIFMSNVTDALTRYTIDGLPETCSERVVLQSLLWHGCAVFFEKDGAIYALPGATSGDGYNINGDPGSAWVYSRNGILSEDVKLFIPGSDVSAFLEKTNGSGIGGKPKGVMVWENQMRYPFINAVLYYSEQMADTLRTIEVGRRWLKRPVITFAEESVRETVEDFWKHIDENDDVIVGTGIYDPKKVNVEQLQYNGNNITSCTQLYEWYQSKLHELEGIKTSAQMDKKGENLIEAEVNVNNEFTALALDKIEPVVSYHLDIVNRVFGTNLSFRKRETEEKVEKGGNDIEKQNDADGSDR